MQALGISIGKLPLLVILFGISGMAMFVPGAHAAATERWGDARVFLGSGGLIVSFTFLLAVATANYQPRHLGRSYLFALLGAFLVLPVFLAVPLQLAVPDTHFVNAYVEMVSSMTTTGAYFFDDPARLSPTLHLWRGLVAWLGGFFMLVAAGAILAPMNLGGFDVLATSPHRGARSPASADFWAAEGGHRVALYTVRLMPVYLGLTLILWFLLFLRTQDPLVTLIHAMSIMSTSGISPLGGGLAEAGGGFWAELIAFVFLLLALTRLPFNIDRSLIKLDRARSDPELRMGLALVLLLPALMVLRHWIGALEVDAPENPAAAMQAMWGGMFTVLSFLSTTGFVSGFWEAARAWSGLQTPGIVLLGLALVGGGVATTAGGVKLLRVYALYVHGLRELDRLVHPSSVDGDGTASRRLKREGAYLAWVFFMLFALSLTAIVLVLSALGLSLEQSMTLGVAAISTTGPVAEVTLAQPISYGALGDGVKLVLAAAMVLGRLEMLVIIALFNPDFWRR